MNSWLDNEFAGQNMCDAHLNKRVKHLVGRLSQDPLESIPNAMHYWEEIIAAYRLLDNPKPSFDSIVSGHRSATVKRIQSEPVVLIPQDATFPNFTTDDKSKKMGTLRSKNSNQQLLHTSSAISPCRINLGIVDVSMWQRDERSTGRCHCMLCKSKRIVLRKNKKGWSGCY